MSPSELSRSLASARTTAACLIAAPVLAAAAVAVLSLRGLTEPPLVADGSYVSVPATVIGIVAPVPAWRLYRWIGTTRGDDRARLRAMTSATSLALCVTLAAALAGAAAWALTGEGFALVGLASHLLIGGAVWPTESRLESLGDVRDEP